MVSVIVVGTVSVGPSSVSHVEDVDNDCENLPGTVTVSMIVVDPIMVIVLAG